MEAIVEKIKRKYKKKTILDDNGNITDSQTNAKIIIYNSKINFFEKAIMVLTPIFLFFVIMISAIILLGDNNVGEGSGRGSIVTFGLSMIFAYLCLMGGFFFVDRSINAIALMAKNNVRIDFYWFKADHYLVEYGSQGICVYSSHNKDRPLLAREVAGMSLKRKELFDPWLRVPENEEKIVLEELMPEFLGWLGKLERVI